MTSSIERIAVIGAGTMGHGIAHVAAAAGYSVVLHDSRPEALGPARERVAANLQGGVERGKISAEQRDQTLARLRTEADLASAVHDADLVIEAIVEKLDAKASLLAAVEPNTPPHCIIASNTSSLPIGQIAKTAARPDRVVGMHFFNPVHIMKLIEVVVHVGGDSDVTDAVLQVARAMGKDPIVVRDSPGFASSRLGVVLGLEAMRMVEEDVASPADIDKAMELGYKHPMGPLKLTDLVGLDVRLSIAEVLHEQLGGDQYRPPAILRQKVERGELGKKSGKGFYDWN